MHSHRPVRLLKERVMDVGHKWRSFAAERLPVLPTDFRTRMEEVSLVHALSVDELARRREAFMTMWREVLALVERDVGMAYEVFKDTA